MCYAWCCGNWKEYNKGAFDANGKPTATLEAFKK
jgi:arabinogalactan endo-1,4-beta-galactosidase